MDFFWLVVLMLFARKEQDQMIDLGPTWHWVVMGLLAVIGLLACLAGILYGIVWLWNHIRFV